MVFGTGVGGFAQPGEGKGEILLLEMHREDFSEMCHGRTRDKGGDLGG